MINNLIKYIKIYSSDLETQKSTLKLKSNLKKFISTDNFKIINDETSDTLSDKAKVYEWILQTHEDSFTLICQNEKCNTTVKFDNEKNSFRIYCCVKCRNTDVKMRKHISDSWSDDMKKERSVKLKEYYKDYDWDKRNAKSIATCQNKYGVDYSFQAEDVKDKIKETMLSRYGVDHPLKSKKFRLSSELTLLKSNNITNKEFYNNIEFIEDKFVSGDLIVDVVSFSKFFNCHASTAYKKLDRLEIKYKRPRSIPEEEISKFLDDNNIKYLQNDRSLISPLEVDFNIPDCKIAIEFNGLYWHSYGNLSKNPQQEDLYHNKTRHVKKSNLCEEKGYQLFHIFEDEWDNNKDGWKAMLLNALKLNTIKIGARKCNVKLITDKEDKLISDMFLQDNHLQGYRSSSLKYGLYHNNELVSLMTFGKSNTNKVADYELIRFCSKKGYQIQGGASKLLKSFEKDIAAGKVECNTLVSYANRRWSLGNLYNSLGFKKITITRPNYFYFKISNNIILESRRNFQKHMLEKKLDIFNPDKTELENVISNNYRVIYDSGNITFLKYYN